MFWRQESCQAQRDRAEGEQRMGRRQRNQSEPLCYDLTYRCHGREFLLKFRKDRRNYLMRLHEMSRRYPVDVL
jgi:hypothetical protein